MEFEDLSLPPSPATLRNPPPLIARFLHGGPPIQQAAVALTAEPLETSIPTPWTKRSPWRTFSDSEDQRLGEAWHQLTVKERETAECRIKKVTCEDAEEEEGEIGSPDTPPLPHLVPVGLDSLFSVNLKSLSLFPVFWKGQHVRVQRATWFYPTTSGSKYYPVDPKLALTIEKAYNEVKPWHPAYADKFASVIEGADPMDTVGVSVESDDQKWKIIFEGKDSARLFSDSYQAKIANSLLSTLLWGNTATNPQSGTLVLRGYNTSKAYTERRKQFGKSVEEKKRGGDVSSSSSSSSEDESDRDDYRGRMRKRTRMERKKRNRLKFRKKDAGRKQDDSDRSGGKGNTTEEAMKGDGSGEVDELILVVHGIGQAITRVYESFNFVHVVNELRSLCDQQSKDVEIQKILRGRRIQFIPLLWRTNLDFDKDEETNETESSKNPFSLEDIEIPGTIPFVRQVIGQVVMDVPFYLSHHKDRMVRAVVNDANRVYRLFCQRNPYFVNHGRVSVIAHSLGSALAADILSAQPTWVPSIDKMDEETLRSDSQFVFNVHNLFLLGSPLGFFFHLHRTQLIARSGRERTKKVSSTIALDRPRYGCMAIDTLYNIYSPTDPIAYCLNATIDSKYAKLIQPIAIPSTNQSVLRTIGSNLYRVIDVSNFTGIWAPYSQEKDEEGKGKLDDAVALTQAGSMTEMKRRAEHPLPSEILGTSDRTDQDLVNLNIAEQRFNALNPQGSVDFYLPQESFNQYLDMLSSHGGYWGDSRFAAFILTQVFANDKHLSRSGREQLGIS